MTGPEHYTEAERLLTLASSYEGGSNNERFYLAAAQVHATLAAAAATIAAPFVGEGNTTQAWLRVTSDADAEEGTHV